VAQPRTRLIVNTDAKNEADDQFAIVQALLSPSLDIEGIIPAHFGTRRTSESLRESRDEVDLLLALLGMKDVRVENGAPHAMPDEATPVLSDGSRLIIEQALRTDTTAPLFVIFLGPLTDMAAALLAEPSIQDTDTTVVWIGGPPYDGRFEHHTPEFNLSNDVASANVVFGSRLTLWQIPMDVYTMVGVGYAELRRRVAPLGKLGAYLVEQLVTFNTTTNGVETEFRSLGDSPAVGVVLNPRGAVWRERPAPRFDASSAMIAPPDPARIVRVCESVDVRYLIEDLFAKLAEHSAH
jgi:inosine-uridine nucleoside N-ribohydrolase